VSLVLPVRDAEPTLRRDVERLLEVLADLPERFELIVVDDGSADHTYETADELACRYPQVQALRQARPRGAAAALQLARGIARGQVALLDETMLRDAGGPLKPISPAVLRSKPGVYHSSLLDRLAQWGQRLRSSDAPSVKTTVAATQRRLDSQPTASPQAEIRTSAAPAGSFVAHLRRLTQR
jgi:glycosyltransferase involved in cell wall biosynthesis